MRQSSWWLLALLFALPFVIGGNCAFFFSSGGGSSEDDERREGLTVVVRSGQFVDAPVHGLHYESGSLSGFTGSDGGFQYEEGAAVRFSIGDIPLGQAARGKAVLTPLDLVVDGNLSSPAVINIARLLQSLDAIPGDQAITIPEEVQAGAVASNELLTGAIDFLDFADDPAFANAASQLVAVLTSDYPRTTTLVDGETAREHLERTLERLGLAE